MPKLTKREYLLKAARLYGFSDVEIDGLEKDLDGKVPNAFIRKRCKPIFDLYEIYNSTEYNEHMDTDDNGIVILDDYAYKISKRRLQDSVIGKGWIISSNLEAFLMMRPADTSDIQEEYLEISEKNNYLMPQLAKQLGIPATIYYNCEKSDEFSNNKVYYHITKNFITEDESLIVADDFIKPSKRNKNKKNISLPKLIEETQKFIRKHYKKYKLPDAELKETQRLVREGLIKQTIFNKLVFNQNENNTLWGLIEDNNTHRLRLAPIYNYNYCANVQPKMKTCYRTINKKETIEDILLYYSKEKWFKDWVESDLIDLNLEEAEKAMEKQTSMTLTDTEREYYNFVIMEKMHSKVVDVSDLNYNNEEVQHKKRQEASFLENLKEALPRAFRNKLPYTPDDIPDMNNEEEQKEESKEDEHSER